MKVNWFFGIYLIAVSKVYAAAGTSESRVQQQLVQAQQEELQYQKILDKEMQRLNEFQAGELMDAKANVKQMKMELDQLRVENANKKTSVFGSLRNFFVGSPEDGKIYQLEEAKHALSEAETKEEYILSQVHQAEKKVNVAKSRVADLRDAIKKIRLHELEQDLKLAQAEVLRLSNNVNSDNVQLENIRRNLVRPVEQDIKQIRKELSAIQLEKQTNPRGWLEKVFTRDPENVKVRQLKKAHETLATMKTHEQVAISKLEHNQKLLEEAQKGVKALESSVAEVKGLQVSGVIAQQGDIYDELGEFLSRAAKDFQKGIAKRINPDNLDLPQLFEQRKAQVLQKTNDLDLPTKARRFRKKFMAAANDFFKVSDDAMHAAAQTASRVA